MIISLKVFGLCFWIFLFYFPDRATHKKMATDAMFKLEHGSDDLKKGKAVVMTLNNLEGRREEWKDDYILNKLARQKFRVFWFIYFWWESWSQRSKVAENSISVERWCLYIYHTSIWPRINNSYPVISYWQFCHSHLAFQLMIKGNKSFLCCPVDNKVFKCRFELLINTLDVNLQITHQNTCILCQHCLS